MLAGIGQREAFMGLPSMPRHSYEWSSLVLSFLSFFSSEGVVTHSVQAMLLPCCIPYRRCSPEDWLAVVHGLISNGAPSGGAAVAHALLAGVIWPLHQHTHTINGICMVTLLIMLCWLASSGL